MADTCGAWGFCVLPAGHNMGNVDVPGNHSRGHEEDGIGVTAGSRTHRRLIMGTTSAGWLTVRARRKKHRRRI